MESTTVARGYRSHQPNEGNRSGRSRSPGPRRATGHGGVLSPQRVLQHYPGNVNHAHVFPKWKVEEGNGDVPEGRGSFSHNAMGTGPASAQQGGGGSRGFGAAHDIDATTQDNSAFSDIDYDDLMTFRTFVITRVDETNDSSSAVQAYEAYKQDFRRRYTSRVYWTLRELPLIAERYTAQLYARQMEETTQRCRLEASQFVKLLAEERFFGISLVDRFSVPRSVIDHQLPFRLLVGSSLAHHELASSPLTAPFWLPPDPDAGCLCWKNVPLSISKWDIKDHLIEIGATEGLVDITMTVPETFVLTCPPHTGGPDTCRVAWIKYSSEEACAAADMKLDGTRCGNAVCRPVRRISNVSNYSFRVAPSETCHPARILRDLHISARLILKLDKAFGVSELLGGNSVVNEVEKDGVNGPSPSDEQGTSNQVSFEAACLSHPVLGELFNVIHHTGRHPEEQLDLQLLYLRIAHNVCYYSGRRFNSPRELWDTAGVLYVRPSLSNSSNIASLLPGFGSEHEGWDKAYIEAADVWSSLIDVDLVAEDVTATSPGNNDGGVLKREINAQPHLPTGKQADPHDALFLESRYPGVAFEPPSTSTIDVRAQAPPNEHDVHSSEDGPGHPHIKTEDAGAMADIDDSLDPAVESDAHRMMKEEVPVSDAAQQLKPPVVDNFPRGRSSPWLEVLDARLRHLFHEELTVAVVDENSAEVKKGWASFCDSVIEKRYDVENSMEKWICHLCFKQFRGLEYVQKHLRYKHQQCFQDVVTKATRRQIRRAFEADPYKLPVALPSPTPYLYRMKNFHPSRRQETHPGLSHTASSSAVPSVNNNASRFPPLPPGVNLESPYNAFMGHGVGPRLGIAQGGKQRQYRDLDAPAPSSTATQGNLRATIFYDDL